MSDRELFAAIARGDTRALSAFYVRYVHGVRRIALRVLHNEDDAQDVAQDVFVALPAVAARYRGEAAPKTVLHRVAVNIAYTHATRRRRRGEKYAAFGTLPEPLSDDPHANAEAAAVARQLHDTYDTLHPHYREALDLSAQGLDASAVGRRLGISRVAARLRLHHARRALRARATRSQTGRSPSPVSPRRLRRGVFSSLKLSFLREAELLTSQLDTNLTT